MPEVAARATGPILVRTDLIPEGVSTIINMEAWASAIVRGTKYVEPAPGFIERTIALKAITAETVDEVFERAEIRRVQQWIPDTPDATSGPLELIDLYVAPSDFETGNPTFVIMTVISTETGEEFKATTGAMNVQASLIGLLANGVWPIRFQIKRGDVKDKGGRYLLFMLPPD